MDTTTVPVVGQPVAWAIGLLVLVLVVFAATWVGSLVTVAHEGGHMAIAVLSGRGPHGFHVNQTTGGGATFVTSGWGVGDIIGTFAGYVTPPLLGLAGASALHAGLAWSVLWGAIILLAGAFFQADDLFTIVVVVLAGAGIGWVAFAGSPTVKAALAVGLVWLMLIGAIRSLISLGAGGGESDAGVLARSTLIPSVVWVALFWVIAIVCLWKGGGRILGL